jgi:predicted amidohydrolase YtcJ
MSVETARVVVSAQYAAYNGNLDEAIRTVGRERAERQPPVRELLDHHLIVSTGSDYIGGAAETDNPLIPFYFYVTRKTKDGRVVGPEEKISREEALRVSTINYAYTTFEEKVKGSIEPGKLADFLILSDDVLTVPDDKILSIHSPPMSEDAKSSPHVTRLGKGCRQLARNHSFLCAAANCEVRVAECTSFPLSGAIQGE